MLLTRTDRVVYKSDKYPKYAGVGTVINRKGPYLTVEWPNGHIGSHYYTNLKRAKQETKMSKEAKGKYYVFNPNGEKPTQLRNSHEDAVKEATRLTEERGSKATFLILRVENLVHPARPPVEVI